MGKRFFLRCFFNNGSFALAWKIGDVQGAPLLVWDSGVSSDLPLFQIREACVSLLSKNPKYIGFREMNAETQTYALEARNIYQSYQTSAGMRVNALQSVSFGVYPGEFVSIIGPSGAGKSTLLGLLAGLESQTSGEIFLQNRQVSARQRLGNVGYMPQKDALAPWRTAIDNAIAGLEVQGTPRKEAKTQAMELFRRMGLEDFARTYPYALSGGMRQRVALARSALAAGDLLLLDEPFGALDALTRSDMHKWILEVWQSMRKTILLVTHDIQEALVVSDRILVMSARPGTMNAELQVDLPRPRTIEIQSGRAFNAMREQLAKKLETTV